MRWFYSPHLVAFTSGLLLPLAFEPFAIWPLAIISPFIYLLLVEFTLRHPGHYGERTSIQYHWMIGFSYWLGFYGLGVSWVYVSISEYGYTAAPFAALLACLFCVGLAAVNSCFNFLYFRFRLHSLVLLSFPAGWVIFEWLRSWLLTGFPWLYSGYAFIDSPLAMLAPLGGVYLLSYAGLLIAAIAFVFAKAVLWKSTHKIELFASITLLTIIIALSIGFHSRHWTETLADEALQVHLIQGNIPQHDKWLPENQRRILQTYDDLLQESFDNIKPGDSPQAHLLILPEAAMPTLQSNLQWFFDKQDKKATRLNASVISGIFYDEGAQGFMARNFYNSVIVVGQGSGLYHKQRLVPFGEYVPLEDFIRGWIPFFDLPWSSFTRGSPEQQGLKSFGFEIAPFICYEILYPELVYKQAKSADLLLTISNDAWFGNSLGPQQHFQMARMRALESGKYLIRTTNTGTTAVIDPQGQVQDLLEKDKRATLDSVVYKTRGETPFTKWGNAPILWFSGILFMASFLYSRKMF